MTAAVVAVATKRRPSISVHLVSQPTNGMRQAPRYSMKRMYFPGITDIFVVTDPAEIRTISNDARFDRDYKMRQLAADPAFRSSMTTDAAVDECLFAPMVLTMSAFGGEADIIGT